MKIKHIGVLNLEFAIETGVRPIMIIFGVKHGPDYEKNRVFIYFQHHIGRVISGEIAPTRRWEIDPYWNDHGLTLRRP